MRDFSLSYLTAPVEDPLEAVSIAGTLGYRHVGLRLRHPLEGVTASPLVGDPLLRRALRRRLDETGVTVLEIEAWILRGGRAISGDEAVFEAAADLGAPRLISVGDQMGRIGPGELADRFADLCGQAAAFGLGVGFEPIAHRAGGTLAEALAVVAAGASWGAGLVLDTLHIHRMGVTPDRLRDINPELLHVIQICDAPLASPDLEIAIDHSAFNRWPPGEGALPLADYLRSLPRDRPIALEVPMTRLDARVAPINRARMALEGARRLVERLDYPAPEDPSTRVDRDRL